MSENMNRNSERCDVCGSGYGKCGACGNVCGMGGYGIVRWILGILIIVWVFSIGMKMGEIKAYMHQSGYGYGYKNSRVMPMMQGYDQVYFSQGVPPGAGVVEVPTR